jgi:hypothetical protein
LRRTRDCAFLGILSVSHVVPSRPRKSPPQVLSTYSPPPLSRDTMLALTYHPHKPRRHNLSNPQTMPRRTSKSSVAARCNRQGKPPVRGRPDLIDRPQALGSLFQADLFSEHHHAHDTTHRLRSSRFVHGKVEAGRRHLQAGGTISFVSKTCQLKPPLWIASARLKLHTSPSWRD